MVVDVVAVVPVFGGVDGVFVCTGVTNSCRYVWAVESALHHSVQRPHRPLVDVAVQTCTWIDISSTDNDENDTLSSETMETALEFKVVSVVPQIHEQIVETVNAIPQEWISERIVDIPVALAEEQTVVQGTSHVEEITQIIVVSVPHILEEPIEVPLQECISDGIGDLIVVDVPVPQILVDEVETRTTLSRKRVRQRNAEPPEILEGVQCNNDPIAEVTLPQLSEQIIEEPSLCFVDVPAPFNVVVLVPQVSRSLEEFAESPCEQFSARSFQNVDIPMSQIFKDVVPQERVSSQIHEHNFYVLASVFQDTVEAMSLVPRERTDPRAQF